MHALDSGPCSCSDAGEILADLDADLLDMQPGERLWKLYCFRAAADGGGLRHRVYSKRKADGRLALVTFAVHNTPHAGENGDKAAAAAHVRSGIARVPDLSADDLERVIAAVRRQAEKTTLPCEEIDLSPFGALLDQIAWLEARSSEGAVPFGG